MDTVKFTNEMYEEVAASFAALCRERNEEIAAERPCLERLVDLVERCHRVEKELLRLELEMTKGVREANEYGAVKQ